MNKKSFIKEYLYNRKMSTCSGMFCIENCKMTWKLQVTTVPVFIFYQEKRKKKNSQRRKRGQAVHFVFFTKVSCFLSLFLSLALGRLNFRECNRSQIHQLRWKKNICIRNDEKVSGRKGKISCSVHFPHEYFTPFSSLQTYSSIFSAFFPCLFFCFSFFSLKRSRLCVLSSGSDVVEKLELLLSSCDLGQEVVQSRGNRLTLRIRVGSIKKIAWFIGGTLWPYLLHAF